MALAACGAPDGGSAREAILLRQKGTLRAAESRPQTRAQRWLERVRCCMRFGRDLVGVEASGKTRATEVSRDFALEQDEDNADTAGHDDGREARRLHTFGRRAGESRSGSGSPRWPVPPVVFGRRRARFFVIGIVGVPAHTDTLSSIAMAWVRASRWAMSRAITASASSWKTFDRVRTWKPMRVVSTFHSAEATARISR